MDYNDQSTVKVFLGIACMAVVVTSCYALYSEWQKEMDKLKLEREEKIQRRNDEPELHNPLVDSSNIGLHISIQFDGEHRCSGILMGKKYVLTVAYCVVEFYEDANIEKLQVAINTRIVPTHNRDLIGVDKIKIHPKYDSLSSYNNVAVLRLKAEVQSSYEYAGVFRDKNQIYPQGLELSVTGFGMIKTPSTVTELDLKRCSIRVLDPNSCEEYYSHMNGMFCAIAGPRYAACLSDAGSPALVKGLIVGLWIQPSNYGCNRKNPELFIGLSRYSEFIQNAMT